MARQINANAAGAPANATTATQSSPPGQPGHPMAMGSDAATLTSRQPWEWIEEVVQILKTAFPLLVLSLETVVDQINQRFKPGPEEETYRMVNLLLGEANQVQNFINSEA
jgi:transformation/transcription domain-associated protein